MSKENPLVPQKGKEIVKKTKPEEVPMVIKPMKPMTAEEVMHEMRKHGFRPATIEEISPSEKRKYKYMTMKEILHTMKGRVIEGKVVPEKPEPPLLEDKREKN